MLDLKFITFSKYWIVFFVIYRASSLNYLNSLNNLKNIFTFKQDNSKLVIEKKFLLEQLVSQCQPNGIKASKKLRDDIQECSRSIELLNPTVEYLLYPYLNSNIPYLNINSSLNSYPIYILIHSYLNILFSFLNRVDQPILF